MNKNWHDMIVSWLVNQGTSTVLLFAVCYGIYVQVPNSIHMIQQGYDRNADELSAEVTRMEKTVERLLAWVELNARQTSRMSSILEENQRSIEQIRTSSPGDEG